MDIKITIKGTDGVLLNDVFYPVTEISAENLLNKRLSNIPGLVIKRNKKLYFTKISRKFNISPKAKCTHYCGAECSKLSASPNGCPKIRDVSIEALKREGFEGNEAVICSKRIEKYDFISYGFETFNTKFDCFYVLRCKKYVKSEPRSKTPEQKIDINRDVLRSSIYNENNDNDWDFFKFQQ